MSNVNSTTLLEFANLQMASEALYGFQNDIPDGISHNKTGNLIELDYLTGGNKHSSKFTKTQAEEFMANWEIVSHLPNTATGFSGTLFKAKKAIDEAGIQVGDLVISFRSTEFIDDAVRDNRATNTFEIKEKGWAFGQIADMEKWFQHLKDTNVIPAGKQVSVTGYSLGGHLATAFNILHQNENLIKQTYTFNGAGVGFAKDNAEMTTDLLKDTIAAFNNYKDNIVGKNETLGELDKLFNNTIKLYAQNSPSDNHFTEMTISSNEIYNEVKKLVDWNLIANGNDVKKYHEAVQQAKSLLSQKMNLIDAHKEPISNATNQDNLDNYQYIQNFKYLHDAVDRINELLNEYYRLQTLKSGSNSEPHHVSAQYIEALKLNYQIAVSATAGNHTSNLSFGKGVMNVGQDYFYSEIRKSSQTIDNFYNVWSSVKPSMVAVSQVHYGKHDIQPAVEDQPLMRGNYLSSVAMETGKQVDNLGDVVDLQLLVNNYSQNDFGDTHSLVLIVDSMSVAKTLAFLNKEEENPFTLETFAKIMGMVTNKLGESTLLSNSQGLADGDALESITRILVKILQNTTSTLKGNPNGNTWHEVDNQGTYTGREELHKALKNLQVSEFQNKFIIKPFFEITDETRPDMNNQSIQEQVTQLALNEDEMGVAYRYALKELNPFVVIGDAPAYQNRDDLKLFSETNLAGMTENYVRDRAQMLVWKNAFDFGDIDYSVDYSSTNLDALNEKFLALAAVLPVKATQLYAAKKFIETMIPVEIDDDWIFTDKASSLSLNIDGKNMDSLKNRYITFGSDTDEELTGGGLVDSLYGGAGSDILNGGAGNDYMEGGAGFDTYYIQDADIISDEDLSGKLIFAETIQAAQFKRIDKNANLWLSVDSKGNKIAGLEATRQGNDLVVRYTYTDQTVDAGNGEQIDLTKIDSATITNFFLQAKHLSSADLGDAYLGLNLKLADQSEAAPEDMPNHISGKETKYNTFDITAFEKVGVTGGEKDDTVFMAGSAGSSVNTLDGNDMVVGGAYADVIRGGEGNDFLSGSNLSVFTALDMRVLDTDVIIGGAGRDIISGSAGDDIIHAGETFEHLETIGSNERGDWVSGGTENDKIYGSTNRDFLQGSEGSDLIYGGASDDVILGDANIRGRQQSKPIIVDSTVTTDTAPIITGIGGIVVPQPPSTTASGYTVSENWRFVADQGWTLKSKAEASPYAAQKRHDDTDQWDIQINTETGDYLLTHKLNPLPSGSYHLVEKEGGADYLYGGTGNDLIVGQHDNDYLWGEDGDDILWGDDNRDLTEKGGSGHDFLFGGEGNDTLYGGRGDDTLSGGNGHNILDGGKQGFDTYIITEDEFQKSGLVHNVIQDGDKQGRILIGDIDLGALSWKFNSETETWFAEGQDIFLQQNGSDLLIMNQASAVIATVEQFINTTLGIHLNQTNEAPKINQTIIGQNAMESQIFVHQLGDHLFTDEDSGSLKYTVTLADGSPLPSWLRFNANSLTLSGTPSKEDIGTLSLKLTATDKEGLSNEQTWSFTVDQQPNLAPTTTAPLAQLNLQENQQQSFSYMSWFTDDHDAGQLHYDVRMADGSALPSWLAHHTHNATLTPDFDAAGQYDLQIVATDSAGASSTIDWQITVENQNRAPTVSGSLNTQSLEVGKDWQYTLPITFADADTGETEQLNYHIEMADGSAVPAWLKYDAQTHTLSGKADASGSLNIHIVATDLHHASVSSSLNIQIADAPKPSSPTQPIISKGKTINGTLGNNVLNGTHGNDTIYARAGHDILTGGTGNDVLIGGLGNDTYIFNAGDGQDKIRDLSGRDTLKINGLDYNQLWFKRSGRDLLIQSLNGEDHIMIEKWYPLGYTPSASSTTIPTGMEMLTNGGKLETIQLANGQSLTNAQVDRLVQAMAAFAPQQNSSLSVPEQMQSFMNQINVSSYWQKSM